MGQQHSFNQTAATALGGSDAELAGINQLSGRKTAALPRIHGFEFRSLLQAQRRRLLDEMHAIMTPAAGINGIAGPPPAADDHVANSTDAMDAAMMTVIGNNQKLQEIELALAHLSDGTYGICIYCGGSIDRARLKFQPTARYCLPCQTLRITPVSPGG